MTWTLSSHDEKRSASRYSQDSPVEGALAEVTPIGHERARAAYLLALALPGSACIYQGEELGLGEVTDIPDGEAEGSHLLAHEHSGTWTRWLSRATPVGGGRSVHGLQHPS